MGTDNFLHNVDARVSNLQCFSVEDFFSMDSYHQNVSLLILGKNNNIGKIADINIGNLVEGWIEPYDFIFRVVIFNRFTV